MTVYDKLHEKSIRDIHAYCLRVSERNKKHILSVLSVMFSSLSSVLEIGSGSGELAVYFASHNPQLAWYTSDHLSNLAAISKIVENSHLSNLPPPFELDMSQPDWPDATTDAVFTANTLHMLDHDELSQLFVNVAASLKKWGGFVVYGSFVYDESFSIGYDGRLDAWLKDLDPESGLYHFNDVLAIARKNGMHLVMDYDMPEHYRILHFVKIKSDSC